jgi:hypothetical protein
MDPREWTKEYKIACAITMLLSAVVGVITGYIVYASAAGADGAVDITRWIAAHPFSFDRYAIGPGAFWWALFGAVFGLLCFYVRQLLGGSFNVR